MIKYSFVLPAYKICFFQEALDSILAQTYKEFEIIIVNDASPEDLTSVVNKFDDPRIRYYVNEENIGGQDLVAQWNHCITYAKGEYLILASDDDLYHRDFLEKMNVLIDKYPGVNVFRPRVQHIDEDGNITHIAGIMNEYTSQLEFIYNKHLVWTGIPYYIFRRKTLEEIGGFVSYPLAWHSDDMTVIRIAKNGIVFCPDILFSFRISDISITGKRNDTEMLKKKVDATISFYSDLIKLLSEIRPINTMEEFYLYRLRNDNFSIMKSKIKDSFWTSSKSAIIKCIPYVLKKRLPLRSFSALYIKKILFT